jgi:hypothetical protein
MKNKAIILIAACLILAFTCTSVVAQSNTHYTIVKLVHASRSSGAKPYLMIATNRETVTVTLSLKDDDLYAILIKKVEELTREGWQVYNTTDAALNIGTSTTYYLKKEGQEK